MSKVKTEITIDMAPILKEMWEEIKDNNLSHCHSFEELHDHMDANTIGQRAMYELEIDILNQCQEALSEWMYAWNNVFENPNPIYPNN